MAVIIDSLGRRWNPALHPRGRKGRFIRRFSLVHFFLDGGSEPVGTGRVQNIKNADSISLKVTGVSKKYADKIKIGSDVHVKAKNIEELDSKASISMAENTTPFGRVGIPNNIFAKHGSNKNRYMQSVKDFGEANGFNADELNEVDDLLTGKKTSDNAPAGSYITGLHALNGVDPENPEDVDDFTNVLRSLGADEGDIDASPDGLSGLTPILDRYNSSKKDGERKDVVPTRGTRAFDDGEELFRDSNGETKARLDGDGEDDSTAVDDAPQNSADPATRTFTDDDGAAEIESLYDDGDTVLGDDEENGLMGGHKATRSGNKVIVTDPDGETVAELPATRASQDDHDRAGASLAKSTNDRNAQGKSDTESDPIAEIDEAPEEEIVPDDADIDAEGDSSDTPEVTSEESKRPLGKIAIRSDYAVNGLEEAMDTSGADGIDQGWRWSGKNAIEVYDKEKAQESIDGVLDRAKDNLGTESDKETLKWLNGRARALTKLKTQVDALPDTPPDAPTNNNNNNNNNKTPVVGPTAKVREIIDFVKNGGDLEESNFTQKAISRGVNSGWIDSDRKSLTQKSRDWIDAQPDDDDENEGGQDTPTDGSVDTPEPTTENGENNGDTNTGTDTDVPASDRVDGESSTGAEGDSGSEGNTGDSSNGRGDGLRLEAPGGTERDVTPIGKFSVPESRKKAIEDAGLPTPDFYELDPNDSDVFHNAISKLKENNKYAASVHVYDNDEYKKMRLFVSDDGKLGFALDGDNIVSAFSHKDGKHKGGIRAAIATAIGQGGRKADSFDTILPDLYAPEGLEVVSRVGWNDEYAPEGWNKDLFSKFNNGEPDVVLYKYNPEAVDKPYIRGQGEKFDDWDSAAAKVDAPSTDEPNMVPDPEPVAKVDDPNNRPLKDLTNQELLDHGLKNKGNYEEAMREYEHRNREASEKARAERDSANTPETETEPEWTTVTIGGTPSRAGDRVDTEYGPGTIGEVRYRDVQIDLDNGDKIAIFKGTPGFGRLTRLDNEDNSKADVTPDVDNVVEDPSSERFAYGLTEDDIRGRGDTSVLDVIRGKGGKTGPAEVMDSESFDSLDSPEVYRGASEDAIDDLYGLSPRMGTGGTGDGIYLTDDKSEARQYAGGSSVDDSRIATAKISPDANIISADDLRQKMRELDEKENKTPIEEFIATQSPTVQATALGYDGISVPGNGSRGGYTIITNPKALVLKDRGSNPLDSGDGIDATPEAPEAPRDSRPNRELLREYYDGEGDARAAAFEELERRADEGNSDARRKINTIRNGENIVPRGESTRPTGPVSDGTVDPEGTRQIDVDNVISGRSDVTGMTPDDLFDEWNNSGTTTERRRAIGEELLKRSAGGDPRSRELLRNMQTTNTRHKNVSDLTPDEMFDETFDPETPIERKREVFEELQKRVDAGDQDAINTQGQIIERQNELMEQAEEDYFNPPSTPDSSDNRSNDQLVRDINEKGDESASDELERRIDSAFTRTEPKMLDGEKYPPTRQQQDIIDAVIHGLNVSVGAKAGTGKTSTLEALARRIPDERIMYVAFNKSVQVEANGRMPGNVESRTGHSIAFAWSPDWMKKRALGKSGSKPFVKPAEIARHLGIDGSIKTRDGKGVSRDRSARGVLKVVESFSNSADDEIGPQHLPESLQGLTPESQAKVLNWANKAWADLGDENGKLKVTPDHYRKQWALSRPDFSKEGYGGKPATMVFLDEAQDTPPVLAKVIEDQTIRKVIVGDRDQAIYGFTGAVDYLDTANTDEKLPLNKSYRFGPAVADMGNRFLQLLDSDDRVVGGGNPNSKVVTEMDAPDAILTRTNAGMLGEIIEQIDAGRKVGVPPKTKKDLLSLVDTIAGLKGEKRMPNKMHDDLEAFDTWEEVKKAAEGDDDPQVGMIYRVFGSDDTWKIRKYIDQLIDDDEKSYDKSGKVSNAKEATENFEKIVDGDKTYIGQISPRHKVSNTFLQKEHFKAAGARWDKDRKMWHFTGTPEERDRKYADAMSRVEADYTPEGEIEREEIKPDVVISTAHKSKGLEWDKVKIGEDFKGPRVDDAGNVVMPDPEELRLNYVAVTRAGEELHMGSLDWVRDYTDENGGIPDLNKPKDRDRDDLSGKLDDAKERLTDKQHLEEGDGDRIPTTPDDEDTAPFDPDESDAENTDREIDVEELTSEDDGSSDVDEPVAGDSDSGSGDGNDDSDTPTPSEPEDSDGDREESTPDPEPEPTPDPEPEPAREAAPEAAPEPAEGGNYTRRTVGESLTDDQYDEYDELSRDDKETYVGHRNNGDDHDTALSKTNGTYEESFEDKYPEDTSNLSDEDLIRKAEELEADAESITSDDPDAFEKMKRTVKYNADARKRQASRPATESREESRDTEVSRDVTDSAPEVADTPTTDTDTPEGDSPVDSTGTQPSDVLGDRDTDILRGWSGDMEGIFYDPDDPEASAWQKKLKDGEPFNDKDWENLERAIDDDLEHIEVVEGRKEGVLAEDPDYITDLTRLSDKISEFMNNPKPESTPEPEAPRESKKSEEDQAAERILDTLLNDKDRSLLTKYENELLVQLEYTIQKDADVDPRLRELVKYGNPKMTNLLKFMQDEEGDFRWWENGSLSGQKLRRGDMAFQSFKKSNRAKELGHDEVRWGRVVDLPTHSQPNITIHLVDDDGNLIYHESGKPKLGRYHMNQTKPFFGFEDDGFTPISNNPDNNRENVAARNAEDLFNVPAGAKEWSSDERRIPRKGDNNGTEGSGDADGPEDDGDGGTPPDSGGDDSTPSPDSGVDADDTSSREDSGDTVSEDVGEPESPAVGDGDTAPSSGVEMTYEYNRKVYRDFSFSGNPTADDIYDHIYNLEDPKNGDIFRWTDASGRDAAVAFNSDRNAFIMMRSVGARKGQKMSGKFGTSMEYVSHLSTDDMYSDRGREKITGLYNGNGYGDYGDFEEVDRRLYHFPALYEPETPLGAVGPNRISPLTLLKQDRAYMSGRSVILVPNSHDPNSNLVAEFKEDYGPIVQHLSQFLPESHNLKIRIGSFDDKLLRGDAINAYVLPSLSPTTITINPRMDRNGIEATENMSSGSFHDREAVDMAGYRRYMVVHEFGHVMDSLYGDGLTSTEKPGFGRTMSGFSKNKLVVTPEERAFWRKHGKNISGYGGENAHEGFAEAWAVWYTFGRGYSADVDAYADRYGWSDVTNGTGLPMDGEFNPNSVPLGPTI